MKKFALVAAAALTVASFASSSNAALLYQYGFNASSNTAGPPETTTNGGVGGGGTLSSVGTTTFATPSSGVSGTAGDQAYNYGGATTAGAAAGPYAAGTLATDPTLNGLTSITVTAWIKSSADLAGVGANGNNVRLLEINPTAGADGTGLFFGLNPQNPVAPNNGYHLQAYANNQNGSANTNGTAGVISNVQVNSGDITTYQFVAFTIDLGGVTPNTASNLNFYSGNTSTAVAQLGTTGGNAFGGTLNLSAAQIVVGNRPNPSNTANRGFPGFIDDLRIYSGVLSTSELEGIRASAVPEPVSMSLLGLGGLALLRRRRA